jgi:hypothetical protein
VALDFVAPPVLKSGVGHSTKEHSMLQIAALKILFGYAHARHGEKRHPWLRANLV